MELPVRVITTSKALRTLLKTSGKGIFCQTIAPEDMPIDADGNRADIIQDPLSTVGRMNPGRKFEQYFNGARRDTWKNLCKKLGVKPGTHAHPALMHLETVEPSIIRDAWDYLMGFYAIISPRQRSWFSDYSQTNNPGVIDGVSAVEYLAEITELGICPLFQTDNPVESEDVVLELEEKYKQTYGKVSYVGNSGIRRTTKENVRIASAYFILLEKTGDDWSATSSSKRTLFGVPAQVTKSDKNSKPARGQATRASGEAEVRGFLAYVSPYFVAERSDRNNNPRTHQMVVDSILRNGKPTNIDTVTDRTKIGFSGAKPLALANHLGVCSGFKFHYQPYVKVNYAENISAI